VTAEQVEIGRVGLWTFALEGLPRNDYRDVAAEIDELGYGTIWFGEAFGREALTQAALLLSATSRIAVATGIACIYGRDSLTMNQAQRTLAADFPGRFVLGLGLSAPLGVEHFRGQKFGPPLTTMRRFLDGMDANPVGPALDHQPRRVLAALRPGMLRLAAEHAWGALSYLVPVKHTVQAREILGPGRLLAVEQAVVLDRDADRAQEVARDHVRRYLEQAHYVSNLRYLGFTEEDLAGGGSGRLVEALVAWGDAETIAKRVQEHHDAGADHVCLQVLTAQGGTVPLREWRELAGVLL
jgi:probable F420-dependent oxidoreductase